MTDYGRGCVLLVGSGSVTKILDKNLEAGKI